MHNFIIIVVGGGGGSVFKWIFFFFHIDMSFHFLSSLADVYLFIFLIFYAECHLILALCPLLLMINFFQYFFFLHHNDSFKNEKKIKNCSDKKYLKF